MPKDVLKYLDIWGNMEVTELRAFVEAIDTALNARYPAPNKWTAAEIKTLPPNQLDDLEYRNVDGGFAMRDDFPRLGRHMAFIGVFSYFEHKLLSLRDRCRKNESISRDVLGKKNWGMDTAKECFKVELNVQLPCGGKPWERLVAYGHIRNMIVHCDSRVREYADPNSARRKEFERYVKITEPIPINDFGQFTLSREYCLNAVRAVEAFFDELLLLLP
jgi:hypothetical protein